MWQKVKNFFRKVYNFLVDENWVLLIFIALTLCALSWPVGSWHQLSFTWLGCIIWVLVEEAISTWYSPEHKTVTNVTRAFRIEHPTLFWSIMSMWIVFCLSLIVHFAF